MPWATWFLPAQIHPIHPSAGLLPPLPLTNGAHSAPLTSPNSQMWENPHTRTKNGGKQPRSPHSSPSVWAQQARRCVRNTSKHTPFAGVWGRREIQEETSPGSSCTVCFPWILPAESSLFPNFIKQRGPDSPRPRRVGAKPQRFCLCSGQHQGEEQVQAGSSQPSPHLQLPRATIPECPTGDIPARSPSQRGDQPPASPVGMSRATIVPITRSDVGMLSH